MQEHSTYLVPPYSALAEVYQVAGFADYARRSIRRYVAFAHAMDWAGRRVLDLGCGTGATSRYLASHGFRVVGIDNNPHMLDQARSAPPDEPDADAVIDADPPDYEEMDIRQLESPIGPVDLVIAAGGVLNAIHNLRELEGTLIQVHRVLSEGKLFIFDLRTLRWLASELGDGDIVYYDNGFNLMVAIRNQFSYETLSSTRHFIVYRQQGGRWQREDEIHIERGYPTQGVAAMLERSGFVIRAVLTPDMQPFDVQQDAFGRVVFVAQKHGGG